MNQKVIVIVGASATLLWIFLAMTALLPWQVASVLAAVSIGIPMLLLRYEGGKSNVKINQERALKKPVEEVNTVFAPTNTQTTEQKSPTGSPLLPDTSQITKLRISNDFIDKLYEEARSKAVNTYKDAELSYFGIQATPFDANCPMVNVYFYFYSKWADKTCHFQYSDSTSRLRHVTPDRHARTDFDKLVLADLPWKTSPHFLEALNMAYDKIKPLPSVVGTWYIIYKPAYVEHWAINFENGVNGENKSFFWNGKGLDEHSFTQST